MYYNFYGPTGGGDEMATPGDFEMLLLFAILRLRDEAYGAGIRREIEERTGRSISPGAIYTGLDRLRSHGYVSSWEGDPTPIRGGRRKRFYRLEPAGEAAVRERWSELRAMPDRRRSPLGDLVPGAGELE